MRLVTIIVGAFVIYGRALALHLKTFASWTSNAYLALFRSAVAKGHKQGEAYQEAHDEVQAYTAVRFIHVTAERTR